MGALSTLTYAVLRRALHKVLKYVQCNTILDESTESSQQVLYLEGFYLFFIDGRNTLIEKIKKTQKHIGMRMHHITKAVKIVLSLI